MAFGMGIDDYFWNIMFYLFTIIFLLVTSYILWIKERKSGELTDYKTIFAEHDDAVRTAAYRLLIYLASLPVIVLLYIGAAKLVAVKPTWNLSLSLTLIAINLIYTVWIVAIPLWNLCVTTAYLWAAEINVYMQKEYPLEYYKSKPGHLKK